MIPCAGTIFYLSHKIWERKGKLLPKIEEISGGKAHTNTQKLIQNILVVRHLSQSENMTKMASLRGFLKGASGGDCEIHSLLIEEDVCDR